MKKGIFYALIVATGLMFSSRLPAQQTVIVKVPLNEGVADLNFLTQPEKEVYVELNRARTDPKQYAENLKELRKFYRGSMLELPGETRIMTREGVAAVDEAIDFLERARPIGPLKVSKGMSLAARDQVKDQAATGEIGHDGSDGSSPGKRLNRYGSWAGSYGENISYGQNTARQIVMQLLIDDGVEGRGHRKNIFTPHFNIAGVACGKHARYRFMCVIDFAGAYTEKTPLPAGE